MPPYAQEMPVTPFTDTHSPASAAAAAVGTAEHKAPDRSDTGDPLNLSDYVLSQSGATPTTTLPKTPSDSHGSEHLKRLDSSMSVPDFQLSQGVAPSSAGGSSAAEPIALDDSDEEDIDRAVHAHEDNRSVSDDQASVRNDQNLSDDAENDENLSEEEEDLVDSDLPTEEGDVDEDDEFEERQNYEEFEREREEEKDYVHQSEREDYEDEEQDEDGEVRCFVLCLSGLFFLQTPEFFAAWPAETE